MTAAYPESTEALQHGTEDNSEDIAISSNNPLQSSSESKTFNVLTIGPTGVGKSTWINALANYLQYDSLSEAKDNDLLDVIPIKFKVLDADWNEYHISHGKPSENEKHKQHKTVLTLSPEGVYCVDNEAFRYLVVCAQKDEKLEKCMLRFESYEYSWSQSQKESNRFFEHLHEVKPLETSEVAAYNVIKKVAEELVKLILRDGKGANHYKSVYEVVIDYLIQNGIIVTDPLMREITRSQTPAPTDLGEKYFVDHRQHQSEVTKEMVYKELENITFEENSELEKSIKHYIDIYKQRIYDEVDV
ncbi:hypothetical protein FO519_005465 [Halicephalobus sp. NKZ332]|nr:hypothetical protein FO519_005465 [Halicephalobus sp. NKZ332]